MKVNRLFFGGLINLLIFLGACTKYTDPAPLYMDDADTSTLQKARKVLLINIDGLGGGLLKDAEPPVLTSLLQSSKYTFNAYRGSITTQTAAWTTMMTGINDNIHKLSDSSWSPTLNSSELENGVTYYPSFIELLFQSKPLLKTVAITPWSDLHESTELLYATKNILTPDDATTNDSLNSRLKDSVPVIYLAEYNSVALAGKAGGFTTSNTNIVAALNKVDSYIGTLIESIKNRTSYDREEWLVIINSAFGGDGVSSVSDGFRIMYNPKFTGQLVQLIGYNSPTLDAGSSSLSATLPDSSYNFGKTGEYTMSFNVLGGSTGEYPAFISKNTDIYANGGWAFITGSSGVIQAFLRNASGGGIQPSGASGIVTSGQWHNITFVISGAPATRKITFYVDGQGYIGSTSIANYDFTTTAPITLGCISGTPRGSIKLNFNNIKIYNKALSAAEVTAQASQKDVTQDPNYNSLIGFWPCGEGIGTYFQNQIPGRPNFVLGAANTWSQVATPPTFSGLITGGSHDYSILPQNIDIGPNIFYWLGVPVKSNWSWSTSSQWLSNYESEFIQF